MSENKFCAGCLRSNENSIGEAGCCACAEPVCKTCSSLHNELSPPQRVVPINKVSSLHSSLLMLSNNCKIHIDQKIILFCCQHDQLICSSCLSESHQNCNDSIMSVEMAAKDIHIGSTLTELETRMDNLTLVIKKILCIYRVQISDLDERSKGFKQTVANLKRKSISNLEQLEADFHNDKENKYKECKENLMKTKSDIQRRYDNLTNWINDLSSVKEFTSNVQLFHIIKYLDDKIHNEETEFRNFKTNATIPTLNFTPTDQISKICNTLSSFGVLSIDNSPIPMPTDLDIDQQCQAFVRPNEKLTLITSFQSTLFGDDVVIGRCCFVSDNKSLLCEEYQEKIYYCDHDGSNAKAINLDCVCSLTIYDRTTALVAEGNRGIQIIDLKTLKLGKRIKVGSYCSAITSLNRIIWVNCDSCSLTLIDIEGKVLKTISTSFEPWEICLSKDGNMYCIDLGNKVYTITADGEERILYNSPELRDAYALAVDHNGDVYVAGHSSDNIHRISSDGKQSRIILSEEHGVTRPYGLSFNHPTKELMVLNDIGESVHIYKVS